MEKIKELGCLVKANLSFLLVLEVKVKILI